jgi:hypothetical protein
LRPTLGEAIQTGFFDKAGKSIAPCQVALQRHAVERIVFPRRIQEAFVASRRGDFSIAREHGDQIASQRRLLLQHEHRLLDGLPADVPHGPEDVLRAQPDKRVGPQNALGGLGGNILGTTGFSRLVLIVCHRAFPSLAACVPRLNRQSP